MVGLFFSFRGRGRVVGPLVVCLCVSRSEEGEKGGQWNNALFSGVVLSGRLLNGKISDCCFVHGMPSLWSM